MPTATHDPALNELLAHGPWLRRLAQQLVVGAGADDLVQETWIDAMRNPPQADRPVRPWLAAVLRNRSRMRQRAQHRRAQRELSHAEAPPLDPSPDALLARVELLRHVEQLVAQLDEPFRSTVLRHYFEDRSAADIARDLGIPAATVRSRLKTGLDRIRTQLDQHSGGDRSAWCMTLAPLYSSTSPKTGLAALTTATMKMSNIVTIAAIIGAVTLGVGVFIASQGEEPTDVAEPTVVAEPVNDERPTQSAPDRSSTPPQPRGVDVPATTVMRFDSEEERERLFEHLQLARARRLAAEADAEARAASRPDSPEATKPLAKKQFFRALIKEIKENYKPLAQECVEQVPGGARGKYRIQCQVVVEPEIGGLVEEVEVTPKDDSTSTPELIECLTESLYTLELPPSAEPLSRKVMMQFRLDSDKDRGEGDGDGKADPG